MTPPGHILSVLEVAALRTLAFLSLEYLIVDPFVTAFKLPCKERCSTVYTLSSVNTNSITNSEIALYAIY